MHNDFSYRYHNDYFSIYNGFTRVAGTNKNVFIQVYDFNGKRSEEISLDNKTDNFEPDQTDHFTLNIPLDLEGTKPQLEKVNLSYFYFIYFELESNIDQSSSHIENIHEERKKTLNKL